MTKKQFVEAVARKAIGMQVGGFRPTDDPKASWIGKVLLARSDEAWPHVNGKPMVPLCQINLNEFPFKPDLLSDLVLISIFINADEIPGEDDENGTSWCLRAYKTMDELELLPQIRTGSSIKPMQMIPRIIEQDFPHRDDCPIDIPAKLDDDYEERFLNAEGVKFGGWPTLIQGEVSWPNYASDPTFVFQIDSVEKARWQWGDRGVGYFGRSVTGDGQGKWSFSWQCY
jgi:uncharacterized protein YwqG